VIERQQEEYGKQVIETGFQFYYIWTDWALPIKISYEPSNSAIEIQIFCFYFAFWRREKDILDVSTFYGFEEENNESN